MMQSQTVILVSLPTHLAPSRARGGIAKLAEETGLSRQALHKALSENGNPTLETVVKVLKALGLTMKIEERELERA